MFVSFELLTEGAIGDVKDVVDWSQRVGIRSTLYSSPFRWSKISTSVRSFLEILSMT